MTNYEIVLKASLDEAQKRIAELEEKMNVALKEIRENEDSPRFSNEHEGGIALGYEFAGDILEKAISEGGGDERD